MNRINNKKTFLLIALVACVLIGIYILRSLQNPQYAFKSYFKGSYPADHWAMQPYTLNDPKMIALAHYMEAEYAIYLNPTDKRGYRLLIRLIDNNDMQSTFNRDYTSEERIGLSLLMALMTDVYSRIVPIAQNAMAGNNAQSFDAITGTVTLGTPQEPNILHGHIWGRGNPKETYIDDIKLDGPTPGLDFDMMASTWQRKADESFELQPGNDKKVQWQPGEMEKVVTRLKSEIQKAKDPYEAMGLMISTE